MLSAVLSTKTLVSWLIIFLIGIITVILFTVLDRLFELGLTQFINKIIDLLLGGGISNTGRNVIGNHIVPGYVEAQKTKVMGPPEPLVIPGGH